jgi:hypothetical protein
MHVGMHVRRGLKKAGKLQHNNKNTIRTSAHALTNMVQPHCRRPPRPAAAGPAPILRQAKMKFKHPRFSPPNKYRSVTRRKCAVVTHGALALERPRVLLVPVTSLNNRTTVAWWKGGFALDHDCYTLTVVQRAPWRRNVAGYYCAAGGCWLMSEWKSCWCSYRPLFSFLAVYSFCPTGRNACCCDVCVRTVCA